MKSHQHLRVANPPSKPLLIWDGDCDFCRRWIERWRELTAGEIDYATSQDVADRFPEIPRDQFERTMVFIEPDGATFLAAAAVYRSLQCRSSRKWMAWSYDHVPGFAALSEAGYKFVARHRELASKTTRLFWGNDVRPPKYYWARKWFLRSIGLIYLIAFVSFWVQIDGLVNGDIILPIEDLLSIVRTQDGPHAYSLLPTLCWLNPSNAFLHFLCGTGVFLSLLLIVGIAPAICLLILFASYLSLTIAGQTLLSFQWDILLLETGFLAIFLAPWRLTPKALGSTTPVSGAALFLLKFLLFKLMLMSGVVKLTSGDYSWGWLDGAWHWDLATALDYHYWSQPLPTVFAWWADKSPEWFKHFSVAFCLVVEIIVPFFIWAPRRPRLVAAGLLVFLQIAIAITGNYCFFNLLTIALCLLLIDDAVLKRKATVAASRTTKRLQDRLPICAAIVVLIVTFPVNLWLVFTAFRPDAPWPRPLAMIYGRLEPFRVLNGYGLFRVMTKDRLEIVIEGSADGIEWRPYEFKWKPGDVMRPPGWCAPHQPRLDWQMWFAALGTSQDNPWLGRTLICLLQGKHDVEQLLARNPFSNAPPRYIRAMLYRYRFTTLEERRQTGAWWKRQELREYMPRISLER